MCGYRKKGGLERQHSKFFIKSHGGGGVGGWLDRGGMFIALSSLLAKRVSGESYARMLRPGRILKLYFVPPTCQLVCTVAS